jgi:glutamate-ammonia-ligase adenylyltransferase
VALRVRYRRMLARIATYDLGADDAVDVLASVAASLADAAGRGAGGISLRGAHASPGAPGSGLFPREQVSATGSRSSAWARPALESSTTSATST